MSTVEATDTLEICIEKKIQSGTVRYSKHFDHRLVLFHPLDVASFIFTKELRNRFGDRPKLSLVTREGDIYRGLHEIFWSYYFLISYIPTKVLHNFYFRVLLYYVFVSNSFAL